MLRSLLAVGLILIMLVAACGTSSAPGTPTPTPPWFGISVSGWHVDSFHRGSGTLTLKSDSGSITSTGYLLEGASGNSYDGTIVDEETYGSVTISFSVPVWETNLRVTRRKTDWETNWVDLGVDKERDYIPLDLFSDPDPSVADSVFTPDEILASFRTNPNRAGWRFIASGPVNIEGAVHSIGDTPPATPTPLSTPDSPMEAAVTEQVRGLGYMADSLARSFGVAETPLIYLSQTPQQAREAGPGNSGYRVFSFRHANPKEFAVGETISVRCKISITKLTYTLREVVCDPVEPTPTPIPTPTPGFHAPEQHTTLSVGRSYTCALQQDGTPVCWGEDEFGQAWPPGGERFVSISIGSTSTCALRPDGSPVCWSYSPLASLPWDILGDRLAQASPQDERFVSISSESWHACALRHDGSPICWGDNEDGEASPPENERFASISSGYSHICALRPDGSPVCWGNNKFGQASPPRGAQFATISSGSNHTCALRPDGSPVCWGLNGNDQASPPQGAQFASISSGSSHTCALRQDGSPVCWGANGAGQASPPQGAEFAIISSGGGHTCALRRDGSPVCWGYDGDGQASPPEGERFAVGRVDAGG